MTYTNTKRIKAGYDVEKYCRSNIYMSWSGMKARCSNKNNPSFKNYGGRGITYCKKWELFSGFLDDMLETYVPKLSLDRIDNNKGYSKENCRWATKSQQALNRRTNHYETIDGETKTISEWCKTSINKPSTIRQRYYAYGWTLKEALAI